MRQVLWVAFLGVVVGSAAGCGRRQAQPPPPAQPGVPQAQLPAAPRVPNQPPPAPAAAPVREVLAATLPGHRERRAERLAWLRKSTVESYDHVGHKDPKWDADARACLEKLLAHWHYPGPLGNRAAAWHPGKKAVKAGCDDPLVLYVVARMGEGLDGLAEERRAELVREAADALAASGYPAVRTAHAHYNAAVYLLALPPDQARAQEARRRLDACLQLLPAVLKDDVPAAKEEVLELAHLLQGQYVRFYRKHKTGADQIVKALDGDPARQAVRDAALGQELIPQAWEVRGTGYADTVRPEQWAQFRELLGEAQVHLESAWQRDPTLARAAAKMITVASGMSLSRDEMELWFRRAMEAGDVKLAAAEAKIAYLEPKWHGSAAELLAYGRECAATGAFDTGVPYLLFSAHAQLAAYQKPFQTYYRQPGVWEDIKLVFDGYLKQFPDAVSARVHYARLAHWAGHDAEAARLLRDAPADAWLDVFPGEDAYREFQDTVRQQAKLALPK